MRPIHFCAATLVLLAVAACSSDNESAPADSSGSSSFSVSTSVSSDSAGGSSDDDDSAARGPIDQPDAADLSNGDLSIKTRGGSLVMAIRHDSVLVAFSDSVRREIREGLKTSTKSSDADSSDALGRMIEGIVKKSVSAGLSMVFDKARGFPIADLKDVRYDNNTIVFDYRTKPAISIVDVKEEDTPFLARFEPAEAQRFVSAVRARLLACK
jgi:hypothetical protein